MQKLKSILLAAIIMTVSAITCVTSAYASPSLPTTTEGGISISPFYTYASVVEADLSISGKTASAYVSLDGSSTIKSISVTYSLQKKSGSSWSTVKTWTASSTGRSINSQNSYSSLVSGTQYRVYATFTVTATNGGKETITDYSGTYTC